MSVFDREDIVLPPMHPNEGVGASYRKQLQRLVRRMAKSMLLHVGAVYRYRTPVPGLGVEADDPVVPLRDAMRKWGDRWSRNIERASTDIAKLFAKRVAGDVDRRMMGMLREAGFTIKFAPTAAMKQAYRLTVAQQVSLIKSIPAQFLKDVETSVWQSVMKGGDMGALTREIERNYGVSHRRAALIARDQNHKAKAIMEEARRSELGITEAVWVHSGGGKEPRPEHVRWGQDKKRYEIAKGMWSEVDKQYVWPGTPINCRCTSRSIIPGLP